MSPINVTIKKMSGKIVKFKKSKRRNRRIWKMEGKPVRIENLIRKDLKLKKLCSKIV